MIIRPAEERDLPAILEIANQAIAETTADWDTSPQTLDQRAEWLRGRNAAGFPVLVADDSGEVLGYASYGTFRDREGYAATVEHSVYVSPAAQGRGVGGLLMAELIEHARGAGIHVMVGGLDGDNEGSLRFHERLGFTALPPLREVGHKFGRPLDLVFVQLTVGADETS
mgnify:FL=1